jgi:hypothetical protein
MAQADNLNSTSSRWWSLAQALVWIVLRIERSPREAEEITYSPSIQPEIERAFRMLKSEFWKAALGVPKGIPIDKFRIPCGRHYVDLLTLFRAPSAESGALSTAIDLFERNTRWQDVEYNSIWLKRIFPAPTPAADASTSVTNTDAPAGEHEAVEASQTNSAAPATESEAADTSQAKHPGGAPVPAPAGDASAPLTNTNAPAAELEAALPSPIDTTTAEAASPPSESTTLTTDEDLTDSEPSLTNKGGRPPTWDFPSVIPLLEARKDKPFKDMAALKNFIQKKVQRVDGENRGDGPDMTTVERQIRKLRLGKYAPFQ